MNNRNLEYDRKLEEACSSPTGTELRMSIAEEPFSWQIARIVMDYCCSDREADEAAARILALPRLQAAIDAYMKDLERVRIAATCTPKSQK